jgi:ketosteroid isomerase-like protein
LVAAPGTGRRYRRRAVDSRRAVQESWDEARAKCQAALDELVEGKAEAFTSLWSHSDDTVIMGAFGGFEHGWKQVAERLKWASAGIGASGRRVENLLTVVGEDLACTVDLEHMERTSEGRTYHRVLRCTQVYRLEDGEWKVIVRHADELPEKDERQR